MKKSSKKDTVENLVPADNRVEEISETELDQVSGGSATPQKSGPKRTPPKQECLNYTLEDVLISG